MEQRTRGIVRWAVRRKRTQRAVTTIGWGMLAGAGAAAGAVIFTKAVQPGWADARWLGAAGLDRWWAPVAVPLAIGAAAGAAWAAIGRINPTAATLAVDDALRTNDAIATAIDLEKNHKEPGEPFEKLAVHRAQTVAHTAKLGHARKQRPIRFGAPWAWWPTIAMAAMAAALWAPARNAQAATKQDTQTQRQTTAETVENTIKAAKEIADATGNTEVQKALQALEELAEALEKDHGEIDQRTMDAAVAETAEAVADAAESLQRSSMQTSMDAETARDAVAEAARSMKKPGDNRLENLHDALRAGDTKRAGDAIAKAAAQAGDDPEAKNQLAQQLQQIAEALSDQRENKQAQDADRQHENKDGQDAQRGGTKGLENALRNAAEQLRKNQKEMSPQQKQQLDDAIEQLQNQCQNPGQNPRKNGQQQTSSQYAEQLRDRLQDMLKQQGQDDQQAQSLQEMLQAMDQDGMGEQQHGQGSKEKGAGEGAGGIKLLDTPQTNEATNKSTLDMRSGATPDRVLAEWFLEEDGPVTDTKGPNARQIRVRQAAQDAQIAVDRESVPTPYHDAIRDYSRRLGAEAATGSGQRSNPDNTPKNDPEQ